MPEEPLCFAGPCLDDVMRDVIEVLLIPGQEVVTARRGPFTELAGVMLYLENPRARLSRTETRGKPFSALGEFCWYMSGRDDLEFIEYYIPEYREEAVEGALPGAYGPRLTGGRDGDQLGRVIELLRRYPSSRRAVIRLFDSGDLQRKEDVPCTVSLQYLVRKNRVDAITYMRSNDVYIGLPHDVFCFTLLQEYLAACLGMDVGSYKHVVGSLHLYRRDRERAMQFLNEGYQSTEHPMPPIPLTSPERSLQLVLDLEQRLREGENIEATTYGDLNPFWADIVRLLIAFRLFRNGGNAGEIRELKRSMAADVYHPFIDKLAGRNV